jgi:hypothetical protein
MNPQQLTASALPLFIGLALDKPNGGTVVMGFASNVVVC